MMRGTTEDPGTASRTHGRARSTGRPSREEAGQISERILDIATRRFLERGYGETSINAIAEEAHIGKRTVYARFDDKADLFAAVVRRFVDRLIDPVCADMPADQPIEATLTQLGEGLLATILTPEAIGLHRLVSCESRQFPELAALAELHGRGRSVAVLAALLERETRRGRLG